MKNTESNWINIQINQKEYSYCINSLLLYRLTRSLPEIKLNAVHDTKKSVKYISKKEQAPYNWY